LDLLLEKGRFFYFGEMIKEIKNYCSHLQVLGTYLQATMTTKSEIK